MIITLDNGATYDTSTGQTVTGSYNFAASNWTPAGGGQFVGGTAANVPGGVWNQPTSPNPATVQETSSGGDGGDGGGGGAAPAAQATYTPPPAAFSASQLMEQAIYAATGVSGLGAWAGDLYNRGASATEIVRSLRYGTDTSEAGKAAHQAYLAEFPQMDTFLKEGIFAGESPELQYQAYRNTVKESAARYGVNDSLVTNDRIAEFIAGRNSATEITDRMSTAAAAVATTPVETITLLRNYYGVQSGDLISFYLDPSQTESELTKRYTAARIGTEALANQFDINAPTAEGLLQQGVTVTEAQKGFRTASEQRGYMQGRGDVLTEQQLIGGQFGDVESKKAMERVAGARVGAFQSGGGFVQTQAGTRGLGSAAT